MSEHRPTFVARKNPGFGWVVDVLWPEQSPRASVAHQRLLFTAEKTCIDCHKGIAHHLPDMRGIPGWQ